MEFREFLMREYLLGKKSAEDYVSRFNGIVERGIYDGESEFTPSMRAIIEAEFPNSKNHYLLTLKRYIEFKKRKNDFS